MSSPDVILFAHDIFKYRQKLRIRYRGGRRSGPGTKHVTDYALWTLLILTQSAGREEGKRCQTFRAQHSRMHRSCMSIRTALPRRRAHCGRHGMPLPANWALQSSAVSVSSVESAMTTARLFYITLLIASRNGALSAFPAIFFRRVSSSPPACT